MNPIILYYVFCLCSPLVHWVVLDGVRLLYVNFTSVVLLFIIHRFIFITRKCWERSSSALPFPRWLLKTMQGDASSASGGRPREAVYHFETVHFFSISFFPCVPFYSHGQKICFLFFDYLKIISNYVLNDHSWAECYVSIKVSKIRSIVPY